MNVSGWYAVQAKLHTSTEWTTHAVFPIGNDADEWLKARRKEWPEEPICEVRVVEISGRDEISLLRNLLTPVRMMHGQDIDPERACELLEKIGKRLDAFYSADSAPID